MAMNRLSPIEFEAQLRVLEQDAALRSELPSEDAADLTLAARWLALHRRTRPEFAQRLRYRIMQMEDVKQQPSAARVKPWQRVFVWRAALAAVMVIALILTVSPAVRAQVLQALLDIGGLWFRPAQQIQPVDLKQVTVVVPASAPLEDVRAHAPFKFGVPAWVPPGYVQQTDIHHARDYSWVAIDWNGSAQGPLSLLIQKDSLYSANHPVEAPEANVETVQVHGLPAALIKGHWDVETGQWSMQPPFLDLIWRQGDMVYSLIAHDANLSAQDLIRMAESIP